MAPIHPAYLEARCRYRTRHDAHRFAAPGSASALPDRPMTPNHRAQIAAREAVRAEAAAKAATAEIEHRHRELTWMLADIRLRLVMKALREGRGQSLVTKYREDQPRVSAGNPDGGQWTADGGGANAGGITDRRVISDATPDNDWKPSAEYAARGKGGIARQLWGFTAREFVSRYCEGSINRELPGQFEDMTIGDIIDLAKGGDPAAKKCYKLLNEPRFRKSR